jgi:hypothetical protein
MADKAPQSLAHHTRWDPLFHFFVLPVTLATLIWSVVHFIRWPNWHSALLFLAVTAGTIVAVKLRFYTIKVQDRVIRLEERLRLMTLAQEPFRSRIPELTEDQLCGLRFASDGEVAKLAERAANEKLSRGDIKKAIQTWRPDYWRV